MKSTPNQKFWLTLAMIEGHIAMWAVRQSPYRCPEGLPSVLAHFHALVRHKFDANEMAQLSIEGVRELLKFLHDVPEFLAWNERRNGNKDPYGFCSRYDNPDPDNDFIDLDALTGNVARSLIQECRADYESDHRRDSIWRRLRYKWLLRRSPQSIATAG